MGSSVCLKILDIVCDQNRSMLVVGVIRLGFPLSSMSGRSGMEKAYYRFEDGDLWIYDKGAIMYIVEIGG